MSEITKYTIKEMKISREISQLTFETLDPVEGHIHS